MLSQIEVDKLLISRDNWMIGAKALFIIVLAFVLSVAMFRLGQFTIITDIETSGYTIVKCSTSTNSWYAIEKPSVK